MGTVAFLGWAWNVILLMNMRLVVGVNVAAVAAITSRYASSPHRHREEKLGEALRDGSFAVLWASVSLMVSVLPLWFSQSATFQSVFGLALITVCWSMIVALLVCPPVLGVIGPQFNQGNVVYYAVSVLGFSNNVVCATCWLQCVTFYNEKQSFFWDNLRLPILLLNRVLG